MDELLSSLDLGPLRGRSEWHVFAVMLVRLDEYREKVLVIVVDSSFIFITPPARRAWRSYKFASLDFSGVFFGVRSWAAAHG